MILIGNQMVYSDLEKTRVKLFPNFTRHQLITHTYHYQIIIIIIIIIIIKNSVCSLTYTLKNKRS